jgi:hypothetical protein
MNDYWNDPANESTSKESDAVWEMLEAAGVDDSINGEVCELIDGLVGKANNAAERIAELEARQVPDGYCLITTSALRQMVGEEQFANLVAACVYPSAPAGSGEVKPQSPERADRPMKYSGWDEDDDISNLMGG